MNLEENKVREGAREIIALAKKFHQLLNELNKKVPIPPECEIKAANIIIEEIDKSDLDPIVKDTIKLNILAMFETTPDYIS